jgi:hypothetical protein
MLERPRECSPCVPKKILQVLLAQCLLAHLAGKFIDFRVNFEGGIAGWQVADRRTGSAFGSRCGHHPFLCA